MIDVLFFGKFSDLLQVGEKIQLSSDQVSTVEDVFKQFANTHPTIYQAISEPQVLVAVNQQIVPLHSAVKEGDTVAFLPPVTGG